MPNKKSYSVKLLQLPVPEIHDLYVEGNIPLAAGYLKAFALKNNAAYDEEIEIVPREIVNFGGDAAILKYIADSQTDAVGFTSYMWNIERNLYLAHKIKASIPQAATLLGGPEITPNHWSLESNAVDSFIMGEGETAFSNLLRDLKNGSALRRIYRTEFPANLDKIPNPYLEKVLLPFQNESMFLETMRGCPYLCKYCFYSKSDFRMRYFPDYFLPKLFKVAREYEVPEIYLMDPSFNVTPGLMDRLESIRRFNASGIPIHTEIRLESVTPKIASAMKQAGFHSVEVGLQSVNGRALEAIGRPWDKKKFIRGAGLLKAQGIDVKTGVILGLPYDTMRDFEDTLDFLMQLELEESMEIYPLSLIPGTRLRDEADAYGLRYMPQPPYWVTSTPHIDEKTMKNTVEFIELKLDIEFFPPIIPIFENPYPLFTHFLDLRTNPTPQLETLFLHPEKIGHSLTIILNPQVPMELLLKLGAQLKESNPFTLVQLVIDQDDIPSQIQLRHLKDAFYRPSHYFNRIHHFKIDSQNTYSLRFYLLTGSLETADKFIYQPFPCDLILRYSSSVLLQGRDVLEEKPILLVDSPISSLELEELERLYDGFESLLVVKTPS
jgi:radical SAM superfamily enzyme YgiQ (UPF0313 family)